jgi:signal peptidase II
VVDWIELPHWPVFNLADSAIVCGGVLVVALSMRGIRLDGRRDDPAAGEAEPASAAQPVAAQPAETQPAADAQPARGSAAPARPSGGAR